MSKTLRFFGVVIGVCLSSSLVMTAFASPQSVNLTFGFPDAVTVHEVEEPDFSDPDFLWGYEEGKQYFLSSLEKNVDLRVGMFGTTGDGCTWVPDSWGSANFRPACDRHDFCYSRQSSQDRLTCDKLFHVDLLNICWAAYNGQSTKHSACKGVAWSYYHGVRQFGGSYYQGRGKNN